MLLQQEAKKILSSASLLKSLEIVEAAISQNVFIINIYYIGMYRIIILEHLNKVENQRRRKSWMMKICHRTDEEAESNADKPSMDGYGALNHPLP